MNQLVAATQFIEGQMSPVIFKKQILKILKNGETGSFESNNLQKNIPK
jgi:invasion protein IalB